MNTHRISILVVAISYLACAAPMATAAETRLVVGSQINPPAGLPRYSEELNNFWGTNMELIKSPYLRARVMQADVKDFTEAAMAGISLDVTRPAGTSILVIKATGADEALCQKYVDALAHEFLAYEVEKKKRCYEEAIDLATSAIDQAGQDVELKRSLEAYRRQLRFVALVDMIPVFEPWPEQ
jgi:hypothetical protein